MNTATAIAKFDDLLREARRRNAGKMHLPAVILEARTGDYVLNVCCGKREAKKVFSDLLDDCPRWSISISVLKTKQDVVEILDRYLGRSIKQTKPTRLQPARARGKKG